MTPKRTKPTTSKNHTSDQDESMTTVKEEGEPIKQFEVHSKEKTDWLEKLDALTECPDKLGVYT